MQRKYYLIPMIALMIGLLTAGTAYAEGWTQTAGNWRYIDSYGNAVTNEWRKDDEGSWRYLGSNGNMLINSWVDDTYYVDNNGVMVSNKWAQLSDGTETHWYYFNESGKKVTGTWKNLNDLYYHFNDEGHMETGWVLDNMYFCDLNDGHMKTGWQKLQDPEDHNDGYDLPGDTSRTHWYYFQSSGKKYVPDGSTEYTEKRIDGNRYCFDQHGAMQTGWVRLEEGIGIQGWKYYNEDGTCRTGWYSLYPPEDLADNYEHSVEWFYFLPSGMAAAANSDRLSAADFRRINSKNYLFNKYGTPVYGLQKVETGDGEYETYYFGTYAQSCVQKGKISVTEADGTKSTFYFTNSGTGYTGVKDNYLYYKGKVQKADGAKYEIIRVNGLKYFVNSAGYVQKKKTVRADGDVIVTGPSGEVISINGIAYTGTGRSPYEPTFE